MTKNSSPVTPPTTPATNSETAQRRCPRCKRSHPLAAFKLSSRAQGCKPGWCRSCVNETDRARYAKNKRRLINEQLRRIRWASPSSHVLDRFREALAIAGGPTRLARHLAAIINSSNRGAARRGERALMIVGLASSPGLAREVLYG